MKKIIGKIKTLKNPKKINKVGIAATVLVFGIVGYVILSRSMAADSFVDLQGESLTGSDGAGVGSDGGASGGQYFKFASETPPPPPPPSGNASDPILPTFSGTCPTIQNGQVAFSSDSNRIVHFRMDNNTSTKGPLIFLWHGRETADTRDQDADTIANNLLQSSTVSSLVNSGAVLAIMKMHTPLIWDNASSWSTSNRDLNLVDAVTACAVKQNLVDSKRIHSVGMSWGGYQTSHLAYVRSNYIASAVAMSGGFTGSPSSGAIQRPSNKFAAIATIGNVSAGEMSAVVPSLQGFRDYAKSNGQFVTYCAHSGGHIPIPNGGPMIQRFFQDHPYGVAKAYSALPAPPFLSSCSVY